MSKRNNICYLASAGAGKTSWLIKKLLERKKEIKDHKKIAIVTFTVKNQEVIKNRIIKENGFVPANIYVLGWYEFLLKFIINPYKGTVIPFLYNTPIGFILVEGHSNLNKDSKGNYYSKYKKGDIITKYLTKDKSNFYSDMLSQFAYECINKNLRNFKERLSSIFDSIYFDEAQDFVGYDFDVIKAIIKECDVSCIITSDPRQHTYSTHAARKYKCYSGRIDSFLKDKVNSRKKECIQIDNYTLIKSHRCPKEICNLSSKLTPLYPPTEFCECETCKLKRRQYSGLSGCFLLKKSDVDDFYKLHNSIALTFSQATKISTIIEKRINFGKSKGWECNSSIIYSTALFMDWLKDHNTKLPDETRAKFYVALTRSRFLTAIVVNDNFDNSDVDIPFWNHDLKNDNL